MFGKIKDSLTSIEDWNKRETEESGLPIIGAGEQEKVRLKRSIVEEKRLRKEKEETTEKIAKLEEEIAKLEEILKRVEEETAGEKKLQDCLRKEIAVKRIKQQQELNIKCEEEFAKTVKRVEKLRKEAQEKIEEGRKKMEKIINSRIKVDDQSGEQNTSFGNQQTNPTSSTSFPVAVAAIAVLALIATYLITKYTNLVSRIRKFFGGRSNPKNIS